MEDYDEKIDKDVDSIINQLKNQTKSLKKVEKEVKPQLQKENMEQYIIDKTTEIVDGCVEVIGVIQDEIKLAPDPKLIESGATFINAFASALDALNKLELNKQKINAQKEIKQLEASSKLLKNEDDSKNGGLYVSREELIKGILEYKKNDVKEITDPPIDIN
jgi:NADH dehydrogenase/NADH:ubiquinone oxidoreductase subunit G